MDNNKALHTLYDYALKYARIRGDDELYDLVCDCAFVLIDLIKQTEEGKTMPTRQKAEKKTTTVKYGIDTNGTIRVFAKSKGIDVKGKTVSITDVWTNLSQKNEAGEYENVALKLIFKKDDETPENNTLIKFSGFMTKSGKGDYSRPAILVQEWDYVEE